MDKQIIEACIELLTSTLGDMPSKKADEVVASVIKILKSLTTKQQINN